MKIIDIHITFQPCFPYISKKGDGVRARLTTLGEMPVSMSNILVFSISSLKHYTNFFYSFINHTACFTAIYHIHIQTQQRGPTVLNEQNIYFNSNKSTEENYLKEKLFCLQLFHLPN